VKSGNVRDFGCGQGNVRDYDKIQGNVRGVLGEFHNVWEVGTLILTFAHILVAIPVFGMTNVNQIFC
jgi:hypothetical protein